MIIDWYLAAIIGLFILATLELQKPKKPGPKSKVCQHCGIAVLINATKCHYCKEPLVEKKK